MSEKAIAFYNTNYEPCISFGFVDGARKRFIETDSPNKCSYCGREEPETTFVKSAHAVPELIGNRWLFARDECDACNATLASNTEDHLAKYLGLWRTTSQIRGKSGVPQTGRSSGSHIRVGEEMVIRLLDGDKFAEYDFIAREIRVTAERQPYIPVAVYKALAKMAYAIMPTSIRAQFAHFPKWLLEEKHRCAGAGFHPLYVFHILIPGLMPVPGIRLLLLRRKPAVHSLPRYIFVVAFANHSFQLPLHDVTSNETEITFEMPFFPTNIAASAHSGPPGRALLELSGEEVVRGETQGSVFHFESFTGPIRRSEPNAR